MNMNNSDQEKQDQRANAGMEDSTSMTVEYLRARLLSERSVSRSARQRADELAKRVTELEEQLRFVFLQRMKAEKATADVLAILESNGISDVSEPFDSESDQDTPRESKVDNKSKEEEDSVSSKVRKNESESGSDIDFSPLHGRNLSWKGRKDSSRSFEKCKDPSLRRRSSFGSTGSSLRHRSGKSCRQIRCKESRSVDEELKMSTTEPDTPENGAATTYDIKPGILGEVGKIGEERALLTELPLSGCLENGRNPSSNEPDCNSCGNRDMEKALERQAQLIGRYEAMEKAQREWEEKFAENNISTPDSCDPGNRSDVTEERYEIKNTQHPADTSTHQTHRGKSEEDLLKIQPHGILPPAHSLQERESSSTPASGSPTPDFVFPMGKGMPNQESIRKHYHQSSPRSHHHQHSPISCDSPGVQSAAIVPSNASSSISNGKTFGSENEHNALVSHKVQDELGGVLEALNQARQSLQRKIRPVPLPEGGTVGRSIEPSVPNAVARDKLEIPVGCVGLFRLPTDFSVEGNTQANFLSSSARSSLGNYYPDAGFPEGVSNQFVTTPYLGTTPYGHTEDRFFTSRFVEGGPRISSERPYFDPYMDTSLPSASRYTYPLNPSYPELMEQIPASTRGGISTSVSSRAARIPPADSFPFSNNHIRPDMYRR